MKMYYIRCQLCDMLVGYATDSLNSLTCKDCDRRLHQAAKYEPKMRKYGYQDIPYIREYWQEIVAKYEKRERELKDG